MPINVQAVIDAAARDTSKRSLLNSGSAYTSSGAPTNAIRSLQIESGEPASILAASRQQASNVASATPNQQFGKALLELLKRHQSLGTRQFQEASIAGQEEQARRTSAQTPSALIGASPDVQSSVRSASASAVSPTISAAQQGQQTFGEQIRSLGDAINSARQFGIDYETSQRNRVADAQNIINSAFALGGAEGLEAVDKENPNIWKIAGLDRDTLVTAAKAREQFEKNLAVLKATPKSSGEDGPAQFKIESYQRILNTAKDLQGRANELTTGKGVLLSTIPGTKARDFAADLDNLKANISFGILQDMREASKTGGALGQVSERELALLGATLAGLDQGQSPEQMVRNLQTIEGSVQRWLDAIGQDQSTLGTTGGNVVQMRSPDGIIWEVPAENVSIFTQNGYTRI